MAHHADYDSYAAGISKREMLELLVESYRALADDTDNWVANLANAASLLWHGYHSIGVPVNWTGFYVCDPADPARLVLAPFQGKVACQTIAVGSGVCGAAAATRRTQLVPRVEEFPGHIACDGDTQSEIVVPILRGDGALAGVLDLDCVRAAGFDDEDRLWLERLAAAIGTSCAWKS
jgi:L-methionine (R)-S-oxide reductase